MREGWGAGVRLGALCVRLYQDELKRSGTSGPSHGTDREELEGVRFHHRPDGSGAVPV